MAAAVSRLPVIGIYFRGSDPLVKPKYQQAYFDLQQLIEARGARPVIVREADTYLGNRCFSKHWIRGISPDHALYELGKEVTVDALFNRGRLILDDALADVTINDSALEELADDKSATQRAFGGVMPPGIDLPLSFVNDDAYIAQKLSTLQGERLVLKRSQGLGGTDVYVLPRDQIVEVIRDNDPQNWVIQEYIDTIAGVPGIIDCEHDIRLIFLDNNLIGCVVRPRDLWFKGLHDKRTYRSFMIPISQVPADLVRLAHTVDQSFVGMKRFYSMDFVYAKGTWYLLELNATSGLIPANRGPHAISILEKLADYVVAVATTAKEKVTVTRL